jgi:large subunit ribosomal protein L31
MKPETHPEYVEATITCACGHVMRTKSTRASLRVGICSKCHPFFTGQQKFVDTAGRVERFKRRFAAKAAAPDAAAAAKKKKARR